MRALRQFLARQAARGRIGRAARRIRGPARRLAGATGRGHGPARGAARGSAWRPPAQPGRVRDGPPPLATSAGRSGRPAGPARIGRRMAALRAGHRGAGGWCRLGPPADHGLGAGDQIALRHGRDSQRIALAEPASDPAQIAGRYKRSEAGGRHAIAGHSGRGLQSDRRNPRRAAAGGDADGPDRYRAQTLGFCGREPKLAARRSCGFSYLDREPARQGNLNLNFVPHRQ